MDLCRCASRLLRRLLELWFEAKTRHHTHDRIHEESRVRRREWIATEFNNGNRRGRKLDIRKHHPNHRVHAHRTNKKSTTSQFRFRASFASSSKLNTRTSTVLDRERSALQFLANIGVFRDIQNLAGKKNKPFKLCKLKVWCDRVTGITQAS